MQGFCVTSESLKQASSGTQQAFKIELFAKAVNDLTTSIFARSSVLNDCGDTESESDKDRPQQKYAIRVVYYSGDFVHQIPV